jgi:hypothetical protein
VLFSTQLKAAQSLGADHPTQGAVACAADSGVLTSDQDKVCIFDRFCA